MKTATQILMMAVVVVVLLSATIACNRGSDPTTPAAPAAAAEESKKPKYATTTPPGVAAPAEVKTRLGTLRTKDGFPDKATLEKVFDNLDFQRGVQAVLTAMPGASLAAMRRGMRENWLETVPGKSWFTILRMYGPLEPWIDKTWRPGEIELVK